MHSITIISATRKNGKKFNSGLLYKKFLYKIGQIWTSSCGANCVAPSGRFKLIISVRIVSMHALTFKTVFLVELLAKFRKQTLLLYLLC